MSFRSVVDERYYVGVIPVQTYGYRIVKVFFVFSNFEALPSRWLGYYHFWI